MRDVWNTEELGRLDKCHVWHPFTPNQDWCSPDYEPLVLVRGEGAMLEDSHGRRYLDGNSSIWTNIHGHAHPTINRALREQLDRVAHVSFLGSTNPPAIELAARLTSLFPPQTLSRVFFSDDGSTAVEAAMKMAIQFHLQSGSQHCSRFIAFDNAYHGDTLGAANLGGIGTFQKRIAGHQFPVTHIRDLAPLGDILKKGDVAAVIIEPLIQGAAGLRVWPKGLLRDLRKLCDEADVFLILDEVMTGFGRTGTLFACEQEDVLPDFLCLAKGLTGGYLPLAATLTSERIHEAFLGKFSEGKTFFHGHTFSGNPLACAVARASLRKLKPLLDSGQVAARARLLGEEMQAAFAGHPQVRAYRQLGLTGSVEFKPAQADRWPTDTRAGYRVALAARRHGLIIRPLGDSLLFVPPISIQADEVKHLVRAVRLAMDETLTGLEY